MTQELKLTILILNDIDEILYQVFAVLDDADSPVREMARAMVYQKMLYWMGECADDMTDSQIREADTSYQIEILGGKYIPEGKIQ